MGALSPLAEIRGDKHQGSAVEGFPAAVILSWLAEGRRVAEFPGAARLKEKTLGSTHAIEIRGPAGPLRAILKERRRGPLPGGRPKRSRQAFRMGRALLGAGLPTPEPLAFLESRRGGTDILILREVPGVRALRSVLEEERGPGRASLLRELAALLRSFHAAGFFHGDCTLKNFLAAPGEEGRRILFSDLDHAHSIRAVPPPLSSLLRIHDLRDVRISGRKALDEGEFEALLRAYAEGRLRAGSLRLYRFFIDLVGKGR